MLILDSPLNASRAQGNAMPDYLKFAVHYLISIPRNWVRVCGSTQTSLRSAK
jgi:hypothetical protein